MTELTDEALLSTQTAAVHVGTGKLDHFGEEGSQLPIYYLYRGWRKRAKTRRVKGHGTDKGDVQQKETNQKRDSNSVMTYTILQAGYYDGDTSTRNRRGIYWKYQSYVIIWNFRGKTNTSQKQSPVGTETKQPEFTSGIQIKTNECL